MVMEAENHGGRKADCESFRDSDRTGDELSRGRYSNTMLVSHSAEEFMMDWLLSSLPGRTWSRESS